MPAAAILEFKFAVQKEPKNPTFNYHLGLAYKQAGENDLAAQYLQAALDNNQAFPDQDKARALLRSLK